MANEQNFAEMQQQLQAAAAMIEQQRAQIEEQQRRAEAAAAQVPPARLRVDPIKFIQGIPEFSGRRGESAGFIKAVEAIIPAVEGHDQFSKKLVLQAIANKFVGRAKTALESYPAVTEWSAIKNIISVHFEDDKTSERLTDEMRRVQFNGNIDDFYNVLLSYKRRIMVQTEAEPQGQLFALSRSLATDRIALDVFIDRMPVVLATLLEARAPSTIEEAMRILKQSRINLHEVFGNSYNGNARFQRKDNENRDKNQSHRYERSNAQHHQQNHNQPRRFNNNNQWKPQGGHFGNNVARPQWERPHNHSFSSNRPFFRPQNQTPFNQNNRPTFSYQNNSNIPNNFSNPQPQRDEVEPMEINTVGARRNFRAKASSGTFPI